MNMKAWWGWVGGGTNSGEDVETLICHFVTYNAYIIRSKHCWIKY